MKTNMLNMATFTIYQSILNLFNSKLQFARQRNRLNDFISSTSVVNDLIHSCCDVWRDVWCDVFDGFDGKRFI